MQPLSPSKYGGRLRILVNVGFTYWVLSVSTMHTAKCKQNTVNEQLHLYPGPLKEMLSRHFPPMPSTTRFQLVR